MKITLERSPFTVFAMSEITPYLNFSCLPFEPPANHAPIHWEVMFRAFQPKQWEHRQEQCTWQTEDIIENEPLRLPRMTVEEGSTNYHYYVTAIAEGTVQ